MLDNPVWGALQGRQRAFGRVSGSAARYDRDVSPFGALDPSAIRQGGAALDAAWRALGRLIGPGGVVTLVLPAGALPEPPPGWTVVRQGDGLQLVGESVIGAPDPGAELLGPDDVPDIDALLDRSRPGPFLPRTVELGGYVGRREQGALVAMAGVRLRPPGFAEVSAVSTDPAWRGRGLATALVRHVASTVRATGDVPFLHVAAANRTAVSLYRGLRFEVRATVTFTRLQAPEGAG